MSTKGHDSRIKILNPVELQNARKLLEGGEEGFHNWSEEKQYPSFHRAYQELTTNFWIPDEVDMKNDVRQYQELSAKERNGFDSIIGLLATLDTPQTRFIYNVAGYIKDRSASINATIIAQQEAIHNESYSYVLSSIAGLKDQQRIFEIARTHPTIIRRNKPIMDAYQDFMSDPNPNSLIKSLIQSAILEGINFYSGFIYFYNLARQNRMTGASTVITFINRDELAHTKFVTELIRALMGEESATVSNEAISQYVYEAFEHAVALESEWTDEILDGIDGIDCEETMGFIKYRANKMASMLGLAPVYPEQGNTNTMPWINAYVDNLNGTKTDFFEQRVTTYSKADKRNDFDSL